MTLTRKYLLFSLCIIGGLLMTLLTGCQDKRNSREWLENRFGTELSRVYPTKNLEDLFKEFPDGFKIEQSYSKKDDFINIVVKGNSENDSISGTLTHSKNDKVLDTIKVDYKDGNFIFSDKAKGKEFWPYSSFLFQHMAINKTFLSQLDITDKHYSFQNGNFGLSYKITNKTIEQYLKIPSNQTFEFELGGSNSNRGYYYSVVVREKNSYTLYEIVSN